MLLGIRRGHAVAIVHEGRMVNEIDRPEIGRRERVRRDGVGAVREDAGVAVVDTGLTAKLRAEANGMQRRPGIGLVDEIGLVEGVVAIGPVLIGAEIDAGIGGFTAPSSVPLAG
ncbi:MAG: hypothetical protein WDN50_15315 [Bradyrhizobium sp.]